MKSAIRKSILEKRNSLNPEEVAKRSKKIAENLFSLSEFKSSKNIMFYVSFSNEAHTHDMIKDSLKSKIVLVPKVVEHEIKPALISDFDRLVPTGKFNILEPFDPVFFNPRRIEVVIVAGTAFDRNGNRIGYGFGYYDRFLKNVPKALKIGLAFDFQIVDKIPEDNYDVPMDIIVTDKEVIRYNG